MKISLAENILVAIIFSIMLAAGNLADGLQLRASHHANLHEFSPHNLKNEIETAVHPTITATAVTTPLSGNLPDHEYHKDLKITFGWLAAAMAFAGVIHYMKGPDAAIAYCAGYFLEQCLSVDNLIVFLVLFDYFKIDKSLQPRVLNYGIFGAVILRGIFISLGAVALAKYKQVVIIFAVVLFFSAYKILFASESDTEEDLSENPVIKFAKKYFRTTEDMDGEKFFTVKNGVSFATPLFLCLICVEASDIVFAFDSVPAIFGITSDPLIVFTSNIFAIAGLRSLFGVLAKAVQEMKYLEKAVGIVLAVIASKLAASSVGIELLTPIESLLVVVGTLSLGILVSLYDPFKKREPMQKDAKAFQNTLRFGEPEM